jgi:hypothetical protein
MSINLEKLLSIARGEIVPEDKSMSYLRNVEKNISFNLETITPDLAAKFLVHNKKNRPLHVRHVKKLSRALTEGRWLVNGEPLIFAKDGSLLDGQHRLHACIESGVTLKTAVVRGVDPNTFTTIDIGAKRTHSDVVGAAGHKNATIVSSAVRWIVALKSDNPMCLTSIQMDSDEIEQFVSTTPGLQESALIAHRMRPLIRSLAMSCGLHFVLSEIDRDEADIYFEDLISGAALKSRDPALVARNAIISRNMKLKTRGGGSSITLLDNCALLVRGWNARINRKPVNTLTGIIRTENGYSFPSISGLEE